MLKLKRFKVSGFRSVKESGWIDADTVTSLIGVNESGKTNLLLPLWKLNPAKEGAIAPLADFPRSEYSDLRQVSKERVFIRVDFEAGELAQELARLTDMTPDRFDVVQISRRFDGERDVTFPNAEPPRVVAGTSVRDALTAARADVQKERSEQVLQSSMLSAIDQALKVLEGVDHADDTVLADVSKFLGQVQTGNAAARSTLLPRWGALTDRIGEFTTSISAKHPNENAEAKALALKHLPSFVYYSNYGNLDSEIYLPHVIANMKRQGLGAKEEAKARTLKVLFDFVKLQPEEILELGKAATHVDSQPPTQEAIDQAAERTKERSVLLQSASAKLTKEFREWWKQGDYRFRFEADGDHFRIWVSDDKRPEEVELESRSTGLQWFLSFFLVFLVESADSHQGAILLLDEPGLSLHPLAQRDLSAFFENLSGTNQLLYTTHSPFMVDSDRLDRVRSVYVDPTGATAVSGDLRAGKAGSPEARSVYAVHAALGLSVSDALFNGCTNVIVEGSSDQHYLTAIKSVLIALGLIKPKREILFLPGGGAKGVTAIVPIITAKDEIPPYVILDSDAQGVDFAKKLRSGTIYAGDAGKRVTNVGDLLGGLAGAEIEDLVPFDLMVDVVSRQYRSDEDFRDIAKKGAPMVPQIEAYAAKHGIELESPGWKVELARSVKSRLLKAKEDTPQEVLDRWVKLFEPFSA